MRYFLVLLVICFAFYGCSSSPSSKRSKGRYVTEHVDGIVDEEYDLIIAPQYDYGTSVRYEDQIKVQPTTKSGAKKSASKPKATKI